MKKILMLCGLAVLAMPAFSQTLVLDPNVPLQLFTTNTNDGYSVGRGMLFTMNNTVQVASAGLYTDIDNSSMTWTIRQVTVLNGNVNNGSTLIASKTLGVGGSGLRYYDVAFDSPVTLTAGFELPSRGHVPGGG